jgi:hypothetical protein
MSAMSTRSFDAAKAPKSQQTDVTSRSLRKRDVRLTSVHPSISDIINPFRIPDDATADELRAEVMRHIARLSDAGIIDLEALPAPKRPVSN